MTVSNGMNENIVKTALDDVFYQEFNRTGNPGYIGADSPLILNQSTADSEAVIEEIFKGSKLWDDRAEEENLHYDDPRFANKITHNVVDYDKAIKVSKRFFDDNKHQAYENIVRDFALKGRITKDDNALGLYKKGFASVQTADGSYLFSDSHSLIGGGTEDNLGTAALSESSLNTGIIALREQKDQAGVVRGNPVKTLLVPPALYKTACEIVDSELKSGTGNNDMNVYSSKYNIYVASSERLGAAADGTYGSDTAWFLIGENAAPTRYVRQDIETALRGWQYSENYSYTYMGIFREVVAAADYVGTWGSTGLA